MMKEGRIKVRRSIKDNSGHPGSVWIIGGGQMGGVLARHMATEEPRDSVVVIDPSPEIREALGREGIKTSASLSTRGKGLGEPGLVILAVKPGVFLQAEGDFLRQLQRLPASTLALSVMAGVTIDSLTRKLPGIRWIRAMTNLALATGKGMTVLCASPDVTSSERTSTEVLFSAMGRSLWIPESSFDAATAIAGSGPGLLALVAEAFSDGGVREGLTRETATLLASWALFGTGSLLAEREIRPEELKSRVSSPAGTTIEGLRTLECHRVRAAFIDAVRSMSDRSRSLSRPD